MLNTIEYVDLPEAISSKVERFHYEFQAAQHLCGYLASRPDTQLHILQAYLDSTESKFVALELLKAEVVGEYKSERQFENYEFDFENCRIKYF